MIKYSTSTLLRSVIIFTFCIITLSSCKKEEVDETPSSAITVINASPSVATHDVYLGTRQINPAALPVGGTIAYTQVIAGAYDIKFTIAGRGENLLSRNVNLAQNNFQSFYFIGLPNAYDGIFAVDDLSATSTTNAFVRFINLSPDAPALNLGITAGTAVGTTQVYKGIGSFVQIAAGAKSFELKDDAGVVRASLTDVNLVANGYYTIIARGLVTPIAGAESPLAAQVIVTR